VKYGVKIGDGDATVPLVSLGYMCRAGWKTKHGKEGGKLNPSRSKVYTREYPDEGSIGSDLSDPLRQGPKAADHVDIMGNVEMIEDVVKIATGWKGGVNEDRVLSDIDNIAKALQENNPDMVN
jgi:phospholipid:diacylglycerol acyltransferase